MHVTFNRYVTLTIIINRNTLTCDLHFACIYVYIYFIQFIFVFGINMFTFISKKYQVNKNSNIIINTVFRFIDLKKKKSILRVIQYLLFYFLSSFPISSSQRLVNSAFSTSFLSNDSCKDLTFTSNRLFIILIFEVSASNVLSLLFISSLALKL